jgi:hypothetical protein
LEEAAVLVMMMMNMMLLGGVDAEKNEKDIYLLMFCILTPLIAHFGSLFAYLIVVCSYIPWMRKGRQGRSANDMGKRRKENMAS